MSEQWNELLVELYSNPELKAQFKQNPTEVLRSKGMAIPDEIAVKVLEDSASVRHLVIPHLDPTGGDVVFPLESRISKEILL